MTWKKNFFFIVDIIKLNVDSNYIAFTQWLIMIYVLCVLETSQTYNSKAMEK